MAKDKEALARLDTEIANLREYVRSDEETDAAEVDRRTGEIRTLLAEAQGSGADVAEREEELAAVADEASAAADSGNAVGDAAASDGQPEQGTPPRADA